MTERFDMVAETSEFPDHFCGACAFRFLVYGWAALVVTYTVMQNLPDQPTETMGDCPDGLFETEPR